MEKGEVENIIRMLKNTFNGAAWHGPSVMKVLEDVDHEMAFKEIKNIHSIAELVDHMYTWRRFAIERLKGNNSYDVTERNDWIKFDKANNDVWTEIKSRLLISQNELIDELKKISDMKLSELVEDKAYDFYTLLHGVIQHDIYHSGQISLLKKQ